MELFLILFLIPPLVIIQTIVGVGVLVLGTPILLLLNYNIIYAIDLLLPISIFTSLLNITIFSKYSFKKIEKKKIQIFFYNLYTWNFNWIKIIRNIPKNNQF